MFKIATTHCLLASCMSKASTSTSLTEKIIIYCNIRHIHILMLYQYLLIIREPMVSYLCYILVWLSSLRRYWHWPALIDSSNYFPIIKKEILFSLIKTKNAKSPGNILVNWQNFRMSRYIVWYKVFSHLWHKVGELLAVKGTVIGTLGTYCEGVVISDACTDKPCKISNSYIQFWLDYTIPFIT